MNKEKKRLVGKISLALLGVLVMILMLNYLPAILELTLSMDKFRDYIISIGALGPLVFILFQILQTVVAPIPGEVIQIAGGYIYGVPLGTIYTTAGMLAGAVTAFYFTRLLGGSWIQNLLKQKFPWMATMTDGKKFSVFLLVFFLVPGLPKDLLIYLAGVTTIKPFRFFGILLIGRFPWLLASVSIGANIYQKNYTLTIILSVIALLAFVLGLLGKDKLISIFSRRSGTPDQS